MQHAGVHKDSLFVFSNARPSPIGQVLILQPFNYAKNMTQQKRPIEIGPVMYRGVGANAGEVAEK